MGIFTLLLRAVLYLTAIAIDITLVFLVVHLLCRRWPRGLLLALDKVGMPVVQHVKGTTGRFWASVQPSRQLSERKQLLLAVLIICLLSVVIIGVAAKCSQVDQSIPLLRMRNYETSLQVKSRPISPDKYNTQF